MMEKSSSSIGGGVTFKSVKIVWIAPTKEGIEEPAIAEGICTFDRKQGFGTIIRGIDRIEVECNAYLSLGRDVRAKAWHR